LLAGGGKGQPNDPAAAQASAAGSLRFGAASAPDAAVAAAVTPPPETPPETPPAASKEPKPIGDATHFDPIAYLPEAQRLARTELEDGELTQIIAQNMRP